MELKHMWKSLIVIILLLQGCVSHRIALNSVEMPSKINSDQIAKSRVAIMPAAGRINSKGNILLLNKGMNEYINYTSESDGIIGSEEVERIILERPELLKAYKDILSGLVDYNQVLTTHKTGDFYTVEQAAWDGEKGLNYENILALYNGEKTNNKVSKARVDWFITIKKELKEQGVLLSSVEELASALNSDYLLVPVILDNYHYAKNLSFIFFIPFMYTYNLNYSKDIALYLIDRKSAKIVKATVGKDLSPLLVAMSLQRILEKGQFAGSISLKKK